MACGSGVLRIEEIEVDGRSIAPAEVIRSVRARLERYRVQPEISSPVGQLSARSTPHDLKMESASV